MAGNQQPRVLQALDVARTQWYHFTAIAIAGMGFFTDAYDLFSISLVVDLIGHWYYGVRAPRKVAAAINVIALCGTVPGQLVFGWLGDKMGRKRIYGVTLMLMVVCSLASGFSFSKRTGRSVVTVLCFFRFWLGVSIGGDYPLSATIMSEYANKKTRGAFIAAVFAMQGFGNLASGIVGVITSKAFEHASPSDVDYVWRIVLMIGAIPALLTYYWRMQMPETARYTALVANNAKQAMSDMSRLLSMHITPQEEEEAPVDDELVGRGNDQQYGIFSAEFRRRHGIHLIGTTMCWFVLDVTFYSLNLFTKDIFIHIGVLPCPNEKGNQLTWMIKAIGLQTAVALGGTLPGYFFAVAFIDRIGRIKIQLLGFTMMTVCTLCLAIPYKEWQKDKDSIGFVIMYGFTFFFANFGPNTTTFILPAEIFPARLRSTCHGICGAVGKVGAIIGVLAFSFMETQFRDLLFVLVGCNLVGILFTLLLPETMGKSLEEITGETEERQHLDDEAPVASAAQDVQAVSF